MPRNLPALLLGAALAAAAAMTLVLTSGMTFFGDSWELLMNRRDLTLDALLKPHNEHLVAIPVLIEQACLRLFGMASATPEYVLLTAFLLATALLLFVYLKRRVGAWLALFAAIGFLCLGRSRSPSSVRSASASRCCSRSNAKTAVATSPPVRS
jgi:hypothetical protein